MPRIFPSLNVENVVICLSGIGSKTGFSVSISNLVTDFQFLFNGQCFPLYLYDEAPKDYASPQPQLFDKAAETKASGLERRDALTGEGLAHFQDAYPGAVIGNEDVFYYIYGLLHSPDYRDRYADNLTKELPRIPCVKEVGDFWLFSEAGRALATLHLNYESVETYTATIDGDASDLTPDQYRVTKMKYGKKGAEKDLSTIHYNTHLTVRDIPLEAYDYVVNGKSAIDWVMDRQCVKTDKSSGITNDANDWALETMEDPRYPFDLLLRVITVSLESMKIVTGLPKLEVVSPRADA